MANLPLVIGNWKLNLRLQAALDLAARCAALADDLRGQAEVGAAPSFVYAPAVRESAQGSALRVYAQNVSSHAHGAYTGEVSAEMLREVGLWGSLVGHSERRHLYREADEIIGRKAERLRHEALQVVLCVGETLAERDAGNTLAVVDRQMETGLAGVDSLEGVTVAYEPVWAIGTGRTASAAQAQEVHAHLRRWLVARYDARQAAACRLLYGGSVKADNAAGLAAEQDVDGFLVGGASLDAESFAAIARAAAARRAG